MDDYFKIRSQLKELQLAMQLKLEHILKLNGFGKELAWFNFNNDRMIIIWNGGGLPKTMIDDIEKEFGEIEYIYSTQISENINIVMKGV